MSRTALQWTLLAAAALVPIAAAASEPASFAFEAEAASQITAPFHVEWDHNASGKHCVVQPLKSGRPPAVSCKCVYKIRVAVAGRYRLWGRAWWPNGCSNSVDVRMDNGPRATLGQDGTYSRWHWVQLKGRSFDLKPGVHTFEMLNREDGPEMDQFYFTTDADYVPAGIVRDTPGLLAK